MPQAVSADWLPQQSNLEAPGIEGLKAWMCTLQGQADLGKRRGVTPALLYFGGFKTEFLHVA